MNTFFNIYSIFSFAFFDGILNWSNLDIVIPIYFFWIIPPFWIFIFPLYFIIYSIILYISMKRLKIDKSTTIVRRVIMKISFFGFLCDMITASIFIALLYIPLIVFGLKSYEIYLAKWLDSLWNPFDSIFALSITCLIIFLSRIINYKLNKRYIFSKLDIEEENKKKLALSIAIFTAPYMFFFTITI